MGSRTGVPGLSVSFILARGQRGHSFQMSKLRGGSGGARMVHRGVTWSAMVIAGVMAYEFGLRDFAFLMCVGIGFIPAGVVLSSVIRRFLLVRLRLTDSMSLNLTKTYPDGQSHR